MTTKLTIYMHARNIDSTIITFTLKKLWYVESQTDARKASFPGIPSQVLSGSVTHLKVSGQ